MFCVKRTRVSARGMSDRVAACRINKWRVSRTDLRKTLKSFLDTIRKEAANLLEMTGTVSIREFQFVILNIHNVEEAKIP